MSDEDNTTTAASMMATMQAMFTQMSETLNNNNNNMNININGLRAEMNSNNEATRLELLERIDQRSRLSTRTSTRAG